LTRAAREGLREDELALFDLLVKDAELTSVRPGCCNAHLRLKADIWPAIGRRAVV